MLERHGLLLSKTEQYDPGMTNLNQPAGPPLLHLTISQLSYLVAVADVETFSAAASSLGVSTSALSQGLAELERRVGVPLFERSGRRQILRDEAADVVSYARRVVADTRDLSRWAADTAAGRTGRLRVGMIDAAAVEHFPEHLRAFRRTNPDVVFRLIVSPSGELLEMLRRGELDVAVLVEPARADDDIDIDVLLDEPIVVVAPEGQTIGEPASWGPWVLFPHGSHTRILIESNLRALGATVEVVAESHQPEVLREMARLGVGWTALPQAQASSRGDSAGEVGPILGTRRLVVARRRTRTAHPAAETFVETLRGVLGGGTD